MDGWIPKMMGLGKPVRGPENSNMASFFGIYSFDFWGLEPLGYTLVN